MLTEFQQGIGATPATTALSIHTARTGTITRHMVRG